MSPGGKSAGNSLASVEADAAACAALAAAARAATLVPSLLMSAFPPPCCTAAAVATAEIGASLERQRRAAPPRFSVASAARPIHEGWLLTRRSVRGLGWKQRYVVLAPLAAGTADVEMRVYTSRDALAAPRAEDVASSSGAPRERAALLLERGAVQRFTQHF